MNKRPGRSDADKNWRKTSNNMSYSKNKTRIKCRPIVSNPYSPHNISFPQVWLAKYEDTSNLGLVQSLVATFCSWFWDLLSTFNCSTPQNSPEQAYDIIAKNVNFQFSSVSNSYPQTCIPCDQELKPSRHCSCYAIPIMKTFRLGSFLVQKVLSTASFLSFKNMKKSSKFSLIWDTGASISISPDKNDFISLTKPKTNIELLGISKGL